MNGATDVLLTVSSRSERNSRPKWPNSEKSEPSLCSHYFDLTTNINHDCRSAKKAAEEALAVTTSQSSSKIIVPGTPRHTGIVSGFRVTQTPRRRVGI